MKLLKKASALLLAMLISASAFACSSGDGETSEEATTEAATEAPEPEEVDPSAPVFIAYDGSDKAKEHIFVSADGSLDGKYEFTEHGGETVLRLLYAPRQGFNAYRFTPQFPDDKAITKDHKYICVVYKTTDTALASLTVSGSTGTGTVSLVSNTMYSAGDWAVSAPIDISEAGLTSRFADGKYCGIEFTSTDPNAEIYIKEIGFFTSVDSALDHYDGKLEINELPVNAVAMTFGQGGNGHHTAGETYGTQTVNEELGTLDLTYDENTYNGIRYLAKITFNEVKQVSGDQFYFRILYSADIAEGTNKAKIMVYDDKTGSATIVEEGLSDTDGKFVLTDTAFMTYEGMERFGALGDYKSPANNTLAISDGKDGNTYRIKAIYFFDNRDSANRFVYNAGDSKIYIGDNDISDYRFVIAEDPAVGAEKALGTLRNRIRDLTGVLLPVVYDSEPAADKEIIIGRTNRESSLAPIEALEKNVQGYYGSCYKTDGDNLIIAAPLAVNLPNITDAFINDYLYGGLSDTPDVLRITGDVYKECFNATISHSYDWKEPVNVENPTVLNFDFSTDDGYFTEENGAESFIINNGTMSAAAEGAALTYIHVYEKNAEISADVSIAELNPDSDFGLMLRYTAEHAYIKGGYDAKTGEWYIDSREGIDFYNVRTAVKADAPSAGIIGKLTLKADGDKATLSYNGTELLTAKVSQLTPGRIGIYTENTALTADSASVTLLSGQGTPLRYVEHTKLPYDSYIEGGTVYILDDGTYHYRHHSNVNYESYDNGQTWVKVDQKFTMSGYSNMIRLNNGSWLKMVSTGGWWISQISEDGVNWTDGGKICQTKYLGSTDAGAGNMNDKISQSGTTDRIFYCQNYETQKAPVDGRMVFCEFYYSDDNGMTWTKSETDSWELPGNETESYFGECKILECADGSLRMYNSWNKYGCVVYSESFDNGVTWGPLIEMPELVCPQSSMQFVRDPYAENDTTYYMVWVYGPIDPANGGMNRSRLSLAKSTDGKNWEFLGDIWRWENNWYAPSSRALISHIVDPFVQVTEDYIICGSGFSEKIYDGAGGLNYHQSQRQHVYSIRKDTLEVRDLAPVE